jgi:hypothetical protein
MNWVAGMLMRQRPFFIATSALCDASTERDRRRTWYDTAGVELGRFDVAEGWRIVGGWPAVSIATCRRPTA